MAQFASLEMFDDLSRLLNMDPEWLERSGDLKLTMVFYFGPPIDQSFHMRFDSGAVSDVRIASDTERQTVDYVIAGDVQIWRAVIEGKKSAYMALMTGKLKVTGDLKALLHHMTAFNRILDLMTQIPIQ